jgi:hypothetical protein
MVATDSEKEASDGVDSKAARRMIGGGQGVLTVHLSSCWCVWAFIHKAAALISLPGDVGYLVAVAADCEVIAEDGVDEPFTVSGHSEVVPERVVVVRLKGG